MTTSASNTKQARKDGLWMDWLERALVAPDKGSGGVLLVLGGGGHNADLVDKKPQSALLPRPIPSSLQVRDAGPVHRPLDAFKVCGSVGGSSPRPRDRGSLAQLARARKHQHPDVILQQPEARPFARSIQTS